MSSDGEKCLELVLLDGSNFESWCNSILHYIEAFNSYLLNIVDASIYPPNINWVNLSEEDGKCLKLNAQVICLLTNSIFEFKYRSLNHNGIWVSCGCTFVVDIYQRYVFKYHSSSRLKRCWLSDQTG
jgi:hypothetical protein